MRPDEVLCVFRETGALLNGHFQLRSGLHSDQFFQCALVLQYPNHAERLCRALVEKMRAGLGKELEKVDGVIAPALGGIPVGHEMARALGVRSIFAEKEEGRLVLRRNFSIVAGERFVVAEDVVTRGGRVGEVIDIVRQRGGTPVAVGVLVNRSGGKAHFGDVPLISLLEWEPTTWEPSECPLCKKGIPVDRPGSK
jgi:orotate phosphoribosyltransferase